MADLSDVAEAARKMGQRMPSCTRFDHYRYPEMWRPTKDVRDAIEKYLARVVNTPEMALSGVGELDALSCTLDELARRLMYVVEMADAAAYEVEHE